MKRLVSITEQLIRDLKEISRQEDEETRCFLRPPRCLLVEDDENDARLSTMVLEAMGVEVERARTGEEAIQLLNESRQPDISDFAIVFLDLVLRGKGAVQGVQVLDHIRSNFPAVHTVIVSGFVTPEIIQVISHYKGRGGYVGFITKPLHEMDVKEIFQKHRIPICP